MKSICDGHTLRYPNQGISFAHVLGDVCDGAHSDFVMKKWSQGSDVRLESTLSHRKRNEWRIRPLLKSEKWRTPSDSVLTLSEVEL